jgi:hypothetical protein
MLQSCLARGKKSGYDRASYAGWVSFILRSLPSCLLSTISLLVTLLANKRTAATSEKDDELYLLGCCPTETLVPLIFRIKWMKRLDYTFLFFIKLRDWEEIPENSDKREEWGDKCD